MPETEAGKLLSKEKTLSIVSDTVSNLTIDKFLIRVNIN